MFAVIEVGGKQYTVTPGMALTVERLPNEPGSTVEFDRVLLMGENGQLKIGNPVVPNTRVVGHVLEHRRGEKVVVFRYKAKSNYRRKTGHRQSQTRVRIAEIVSG